MALQRGRTFPSLSELQLLFKEAGCFEEGAAARPGVPADGSSASGSAEAVPATDTPPLGSPQHHALQPPRGAFQLDQLRVQSRGRALSSRGSSSSQLDQLGLATTGGVGVGGALAPARAQAHQPLGNYGERVAAQLQQRCRASMAMLGALQAPMPVVAGGGAKQRLPSSALRFCKGLAFVKQRKAGLLGGWTWGTALLIQRLPSGTWSAPLFLRLRFGSLGLTAGAQHVRAVYVLQTLEQVAAFTRGSGTVTLDAALPGELDPLDVYAPVKSVKHRDLTTSPNTSKPQCAMVSEGLMWDVSVRVGFTFLDKRLNKELYGEEVSPEEVLAGCVPPPPELQPLYRDIEARAAEAQVIRPTVSKFELARMRSLQHAEWSNRGLDRSTRGMDVSTRSGRVFVRNQSSSSSSLSISNESTCARGTAICAGGLGTSASPGSASSLLAASLVPGGSPCTTWAAGTALPEHGSLKLFGDVEDIGFEPLYTYEEQERQEHQGQQSEHGEHHDT